MVGEEHKEMDDVFKMPFSKKENNFPKTLHQIIAYYTHDWVCSHKWHSWLHD